MKAKDIRAENAGEIEKQLEQSHQEMFNLRLRLSTRQLVNHRELRAVKKKIARLKTILREKELGIR